MKFSIALLIWLIAFAIFVIAEAISLGLTTIWFAGGAIIAAIASFFGAPIWLQVVLFIIVTALLFIFTRPVAMKHLNTKTEATNADSLIGKQALVIVEVNNVKSTGQVKIGGMEWSARNAASDAPIAKGTMVTVKAIEGVKLMVVPDELKEK